MKMKFEIKDGMSVNQAEEVIKSALQYEEVAKGSEDAIKKLSELFAGKMVRGENIFNKTFMLIDEDGDEIEHRVCVNAYFTDTGSVDYIYTYKIKRI